MRVVVTGASGGIGKATAILFLEKGHEVIGLDCKASAIDDRGYTHHIADISDKASLPEFRTLQMTLTLTSRERSMSLRSMPSRRI